MILLLYPPDWDHFLCALFCAYRDPSLAARREDSPDAVSLFDCRNLIYDPALAARTEKGMRKLGARLPEHFYRAWLSETPAVEDDILAMLRHGYALGRNPDGDLTEPSVARVEKAARLCGGEAQRMLQFVRFVQTPEGVYIADISPACDVLTLIAGHFHGRFGDQALMIRDVKRGKALLSDQKGWHISSLGEPPYPPLPADGSFENLWRGYFKAIANPARKNLKLQQHFVPLRYRPYLTEFQEPDVHR